MKVILFEKFEFFQFEIKIFLLILRFDFFLLKNLKFLIFFLVYNSNFYFFLKNLIFFLLKYFFFFFYEFKHPVRIFFIIQNNYFLFFFVFKFEINVNIFISFLKNLNSVNWILFFSWKFLNSIQLKSFKFNFSVKNFQIEFFSWKFSKWFFRKEFKNFSQLKWNLEFFKIEFSVKKLFWNFNCFCLNFLINLIKIFNFLIN